MSTIVGDWNILPRKIWQNTDAPATTVYGDLLLRHHQAARKDMNSPERKALFDLIEALRAQYPDECKVWDDRYPGD